MLQIFGKSWLISCSCFGQIFELRDSIRDFLQEFHLRILPKFHLMISPRIRSEKLYKIPSDSSPNNIIWGLLHELLLEIFQKLHSRNPPWILYENSSKIPPEIAAGIILGNFFLERLSALGWFVSMLGDCSRNPIRKFHQEFHFRLFPESHLRIHSKIQSKNPSRNSIWGFLRKFHFENSSRNFV